MGEDMFLFFGFRVWTKKDNRGKFFFSVVTDRSEKFISSTTHYKTRQEAKKAGKNIAYHFYLNTRRKNHLNDIYTTDLSDEEMERVYFGGTGTQVKIGDVIFSYQYPRKPARVNFISFSEGRIGMIFLPDAYGTHSYTRRDFNKEVFFRRRKFWSEFDKLSFIEPTGRHRKLWRRLKQLIKK